MHEQILQPESGERIRDAQSPREGETGDRIIQ